HGAVTVLDGAAAFGQVTMQRAVELAAESARTYGMATVAVQNSSHFGAGQFWVHQLTEQGIAGILTSTTGPVAAPFGGSRPILGTNPLTLGLPSAGPNPLVADPATTAGAYGTDITTRNDGTEIPDAQRPDNADTPHTNPAAMPA